MSKPPLHILAPYVATPHEVVERMIRLAAVEPGDVVYDLGCGDGRVVIAAAQRGATGVGIDIEPYWVEQSRSSAAAAGVSHLTRFEHGDAVVMDLSPASVVFLYLVHWSTQLVAQKLFNGVRPGTRVVSHSFPIAALAPSAIETMTDAEGITRTIGLWIVPDSTQRGS